MFRMNRSDDSTFEREFDRLMQLAEKTNLVPGQGKKSGQRSPYSLINSARASAWSNRQDIVKIDPSYVPNIQRLDFSEREGTNSYLSKKKRTQLNQSKGKSSGTIGDVASTARLRHSETFSRPYIRGSSLQDSNNIQSNHFNDTSSDDEGGVDHQPASSTSKSSSQKRWLFQSLQQPSRQHPEEDGGSHVATVSVVAGTTNSSTVQQSCWVSPAADPIEIAKSSSFSTNNRVPMPKRGQSDRTSNISFLHLHGASSADTWESSQVSCTGNKSDIHIRANSIADPECHESPSSNLITDIENPSVGSAKDGCQRRPDSNHRQSEANSLLSGSGGTSFELFVSGNCNRELSPVRWCDREVDGVYLGRSGWVQVQQSSLDENRKKINHIKLQTNNSNSSVIGTIPSLGRAIKLADHHCSNSEPGKCPDYSRSLTLDSHRPDFLTLSTDYESPSSCISPQSIESFSPPPLTSIISPPPAFQDVAMKRRLSGTTSSHGKPSLPRSNAILDSDVISLPPSPPPKSWTQSTEKFVTTTIKPRPRRQTQLMVGSSDIPHRRQQQPDRKYRLKSAKSLEDPFSTRRTQFAQRYLGSSSSSSSSMSIRNLDNCISRSVMPRLVENTDSSVEGYEDGDEDNNPDSSLIMSTHSSTGNFLDCMLNRKGMTGVSSSRKNMRKSPGSFEAGGLSFESSSSSSSSSSYSTSFPYSPTLSSAERSGKSPSHCIRSSQFRGHHQGFQNTLVSPDSLETARVRRSSSLQLPERESLDSTTEVSRVHSRESIESNRVIVEIIDRGIGKTKRHPLVTGKTRSAEEAMSSDLLRDSGGVTEYLHGTRRRATAKNVPPERFEFREDNKERQTGSNPYNLFILANQQQHTRRTQSLQRGITTLNPVNSSNQLITDIKVRCKISTCDYWPHCDQAINPQYQGQASTKFPQSYPLPSRISSDSIRKN